MEKYTPIPWAITKHGTPDYAPQYGIYAENDPLGHDFVTVYGNNALANARLLVTTPKMLEVLQSVLSQHDATDCLGPTVAADVRAVLSEATEQEYNSFPRT